MGGTFWAQRWRLLGALQASSSAAALATTSADNLGGCDATCSTASLKRPSSDGGLPQTRGCGTTIMLASLLTTRLGFPSYPVVR